MISFQAETSSRSLFPAIPLCVLWETSECCVLKISRVHPSGSSPLLRSWLRQAGTAVRTVQVVVRETQENSLAGGLQQRLCESSYACEPQAEDCTDNNWVIIGAMFSLMLACNCSQQPLSSALGSSWGFAVTCP